MVFVFVQVMRLSRTSKKKDYKKQSNHSSSQFHSHNHSSKFIQFIQFIQFISSNSHSHQNNPPSPLLHSSHSSPSYNHHQSQLPSLCLFVCLFVNWIWITHHSNCDCIVLYLSFISFCCWLLLWCVNYENGMIWNDENDEKWMNIISSQSSFTHIKINHPFISFIQIPNSLIPILSPFLNIILHNPLTLSSFI